MQRPAFRLPGFLMFAVLLAVTAAIVLAATAVSEVVWATALLIVLVLVELVLASGFTIITPNEARVVQFFGRYVGTVTEAGLHWTVPFSQKRRLSLRVRNFETARL